MYNPLILAPGYSKAVAAIVRVYDSLALHKPRAKDRIVKQRQRAVYYNRYPFGQKQKAKVLAQGLRNVPQAYYNNRTGCVEFNQRTIERRAGFIDYRKLLDKVSKPV